MTPIHNLRNPGFIIPKKLPPWLLDDVSSFVESESTDREARAMELAELYWTSLQEILQEMDTIKK